MKGEFSLTSVRTLFRLDLRSRFGSSQALSLKQKLMQCLNYLFLAIVYGVLVVGMVSLSKMFVSRSGLRLEYLVIVTAAAMLLATVISTGTVIKNLYQTGDNELLLRFPVSGREILAAKSIYCYLHNLGVCFLIMLPLYISFGAVTKAPAGDYFSYLGVILLSTFLPYFIANIIAVPVMKLLNVMKNKFLLVLLFTIIILCAVFLVYMLSLNSILNYMRDSNTNIFSGDMIERYRAFASGAYPFRWYAELINGKRYGGLTSVAMLLRFVYITAINVVLGAIAYIVTSKQYYKVILYGIETQKASFKRVIKDKQHGVTYALFRKEFYLIFRSFNYSFQYFAMACAAPLMVFLCNRLAASMGSESVGSAIIPGITLMVIIIFVTISVSFASTCISREGGCFYQTKIMPVGYMKQIGVKFMLYALVASVSVGLCCLVSGLYYTSEQGGKILNAIDVASIFGICEMLVLSLTCMSIQSDVKAPTFNVSGDGELVSANRNVAIALTVGIVVAIAFGAFAMIYNFIPLRIGIYEIATPGKMNNVYLILAVASGALLIASALNLFIGLNKKYRDIVA